MLLYTFRGIANKDLTCEKALRIATVEGTQLRREGFREVLLAGDHRLSTPMLKSGLVAGFLSAGINLVDCGLLPTPVLSATVKTSNIPGVMVTASHNPPEWNGFQFHEPDSHIYGPEKEERIKSTIDFHLPLPDWRQIGQLSFKHDCIDEYTSRLLGLVEVENPVKVVADFGGGMASIIVPRLLRELDVELVEINGALDPLFSRRPSEPSRHVIKVLRSLVVKEGADVGFAYDGDADRVMIVDENGHVVEGDRIIFLLGKEVFTSPGSMVVTADISIAVERALRCRGFHLILDRWGQTFIGDTIRKSHAVFGAETNDHYIFPEISLHADAIAATAYICSILSRSNRGLSQMFDELSGTHIYREKVDFTEDLVRYAEDIGLFLKGKYGDYDLIHDRLYVASVDGSKLLIRQSPFDGYVRISAESLYPNRTDEMISGVREILKLQKGLTKIPLPVRRDGQSTSKPFL